MARKAITIKDIARLAGVSKKSVSRAINNEDGVSETTRAHIMDIVRQHGYQPDRRARALAGSGSYLLAFAYNNANHVYVLDLLEGALAEANRAGFEIIMHPVTTQPDQAGEELLQLMQRSGADGLILTPPLSESFAIIEAVTRIPQAVVRVASDDVDSPIPQVRFDDREAALKITSHLLERGYRRVGFLGGPQTSPATRRRLSGFQDAMAIRGIGVQDEWVAWGGFTFVSGIEAGKELLRGPERPDAIMCCNDVMAAGVIHAANSLDLSVPDDIAVTGFDDAPAARQVWPPLTTIRQPLAEMGSGAARLLIEQISDDAQARQSREVFTSKLIERQSVGKIKPLSDENQSG